MNLPQIGDLMLTVKIRTVFAIAGDYLTVGARLMDFQIDLSAAAPHDCPPISTYRIAVRDRLFVRRIAVGVGDQVPVGALLALFSSTADETVDGVPMRPARVTIAGIVPEGAWRL